MLSNISYDIAGAALFRCDGSIRAFLFSWNADACRSARLPGPVGLRPRSAAGSQKTAGLARPTEASVAVGARVCDGVVGANRLSPSPSAIVRPIGRAQSACAGFAARMARPIGFQ